VLHSSLSRQVEGGSEKGKRNEVAETREGKRRGFCGRREGSWQFIVPGPRKEGSVSRSGAEKRKVKTKKIMSTQGEKGGNSALAGKETADGFPSCGKGEVFSFFIEGGNERGSDGQS